MKKKLVAYFSATGTTRRAAEALAAAAGAGLYEIRAAEPYTAADLDWTNRASRTSVEAGDPKARPALADSAADVASCEILFLGFPVWWHTAPKIIRTFLERYDFSGKTIVLFATSGGSGLGSTKEDLRPCCPGAVLRDGRILSGREPADRLRKWADSFCNQ